MASIYALVDSSDVLDYRYVGKTVKSLADRLYRHLYRIERCANTHKGKWMNSVLSAGREVQIVQLECCDDAEQDAREIFWIAKLRADGFKLTNGTDGGQGGVPSEEVRLKISAALTGKPRPSHVVEMLRMRGKLNIGEKNPNYGKGMLPQVKDALRMANVGRKQTPEHIQKVRLGNQGKKSKLTVAQVEMAYVMNVKQGVSQQKIADMFGVGQSQISRIIRGEKWAHLNLSERFS